jgi:hypothetical protein
MMKELDYIKLLYIILANQVRPIYLIYNKVNKVLFGYKEPRCSEAIYNFIFDSMYFNIIYT